VEEKKALAVAWAAVIFFLCRRREGRREGGVGVSLGVDEAREGWA